MTDWHPFCWGEHRPLGEACATCPWETSCIDEMGKDDRVTRVLAKVWDGKETAEAVHEVYGERPAPADPFTGPFCPTCGERGPNCHCNRRAPKRGS